METEKESKKINKPANQSNGKGGSRPGAGRKAGTPNKRTQAMQIAVETSGMTPLDYMLSVMRDEVEEPRHRLAAAQAAAPYVHAKLSSIELTGQDGGPVQVTTIERRIVDPVKK